jgi:hypothetical protein
MARMKEDIDSRKIKEDQLESAERRYFREKYGSLSNKKVSKSYNFGMILI